MYDYETIKKNFIKISEKDKLTYREMCELVGDRFATSSVLRKRQMDKWKQFISWKQNNKKQFTKIKICSEEEAIENIFEKCMTDSLGYTLSAFLVLYAAYSDGKTRIHTSYSELAKAFGMFNEDFNLARFNLPETEFNCETELLGLRNDRYEGLEDMKKAIRQARKNNPNALSTKNHKSVQDFFTRYARNANNKIETVLNKFKKDKVLNYSETYCGAFFDADDVNILSHLKDIYLSPKDKAYYYDIISKNEKGEEVKTSIFVPYKDRVFIGDEEAIYLSIQNKYAHDLGYQNYGEALSFGKGKEIDKLSQMELREKLHCFYVRPALNILFSPNGIDYNKEYYQKSLEEMFNLPFVLSSIQETNKQNKSTFLNNIKERQESETPDPIKKFGGAWNPLAWEELRHEQNMFYLVQDRLSKKYLDIKNTKYLPETGDSSLQSVADYDGYYKDSIWLKVFENSMRKISNSEN